MQIRRSLHLRHYRIRKSALDKIVSVSECLSWSRTVGNLLRNILKLQPREYSGHRQYRQQTTDSTDNRQYRQQTVLDPASPSSWLDTGVLMCGGWAEALLAGTLAAAPELTSDH